MRREARQSSEHCSRRRKRRDWRFRNFPDDQGLTHVADPSEVCRGAIVISSDLRVYVIASCRPGLLRENSRPLRPEGGTLGSGMLPVADCPDHERPTEHGLVCPDAKESLLSNDGEVAGRSSTVPTDS